MADFYKMPSFPTLSASDLARSVEWYRELGFEVVFQMPGPGGAALAHLRWRRYADLMLASARDPLPEQPGGGVMLNFAVDEAIDAVFERAAAMGATIVTPIGDRPWNAREFTLADPDGYRLTFTMGPLNPNLSIADVAANTAAS